MVILAGGGSSSDFVAGTFQEGCLDLESQPLEVLNCIQIQDFAAWKPTVPEYQEYQDEADLITILSFHLLRD